MGQMTLRQLVFETREQLAPIGDAAGFEASCIIQKALSFDNTALLVNRDHTVTQGEVDAVREMVCRRISGEPLQYILGRWEFYSLPFEVGPGVLIPRADTETLVDKALECIERIKSPRIADLCSGSGCVAVAIAKNRIDSHVTAVELSGAAMGFLQKNIRLNNAENVTAVSADILKSDRNFSVFDMIVSNPPYIPSGVIDTLSDEVKKEPVTALDGGADGLVFYRALCEKWSGHLTSDGSMLVEIGFDQKAPVTEMFGQYFKEVKCASDLCGVPRVVWGSKPIKTKGEKLENGRQESN